MVIRGEKETIVKLTIIFMASRNVVVRTLQAFTVIRPPFQPPGGKNRKCLKEVSIHFV